MRSVSHTLKLQSETHFFIGLSLSKTTPNSHAPF
jgi:hypothetical protein